MHRARVNMWILGWLAGVGVCLVPMVGCSSNESTQGETSATSGSTTTSTGSATGGDAGSGGRRAGGHGRARGRWRARRER